MARTFARHPTNILFRVVRTHLGPLHKVYNRMIRTFARHPLSPLCQMVRRVSRPSRMVCTHLGPLCQVFRRMSRINARHPLVALVRMVRRVTRSPILLKLRDIRTFLIVRSCRPLWSDRRIQSYRESLAIHGSSVVFRQAIHNLFCVGHPLIVHKRNSEVFHPSSCDTLGKLNVFFIPVRMFTKWTLTMWYRWRVVSPVLMWCHIPCMGLLEIARMTLDVKPKLILPPSHPQLPYVPADHSKDRMVRVLDL